jgi:hypothetical protein
MGFKPHRGFESRPLRFRPRTAPAQVPPLSWGEQAPVAQLDRASVYGTEGHRFESCRARSEKPRKAGLLCVHDAAACPSRLRGSFIAGRALRGADDLGFGALAAIWWTTTNTTGALVGLWPRALVWTYRKAEAQRRPTGCRPDSRAPIVWRVSSTVIGSLCRDAARPGSRAGPGSVEADTPDIR